MSAPAATSEGYDRQKLFVASCIALITTAMAFSIRADILRDFGTEFDIPHQYQGLINLMGIWGFPIAIIIVGPLCNTLGMGRLLRFACIGHILGVIFTIVSPQLGGLGFVALLASTLLIGLANGTVEGVINPLAATMYPTEKTQKLNTLHAWWPGGLIIGGLLAFALTYVLGEGWWKLKMATILIPAVVYGIMIWRERFPATERAASGVSTLEMFQEILRPGVLLLIFCMGLTAITELGPDQWVGSVLRDTVGIKSGVIFLVYTSGLMFVLRLFAGPIAHWLSPMGMLTTCAALAAIGLFWLSNAFTVGMAFAAATVFGIGKAYFWPTMLGVTSERYPRGGEFLLAVMGGWGMIAAGIAGPIMGGIYDRHTEKNLTRPVADLVMVDGRYSPERAARITDPAQQEVLKAALRQGAAMSFRYVAILPVILVFIFGAMFLYFRSKGGYQVVALEGAGEGGGGGPPSGEGGEASVGEDSDEER